MHTLVIAMHATCFWTDYLSSLMIVCDSAHEWCRYVGVCEGLPAGFWVGVEFDEPVGKNDGCVKGKRYFTCIQGYGGMARPNNVTIGDFPAEDFALSDGDEI